MRVAFVLVAIGVSGVARANTAPAWEDVPALVANSTSVHDDALRACAKKLPLSLTLIASRAKDGSTHVSMPMPAVGGRGFTPEEKCLMAEVAKIAFPDLPTGVDRILLGHEVLASGAKASAPAFGDWRDLPSALAAIVDDKAKTALAACDKRARTVRVILDLTKGKTRVWLPAWQFHSPKGDGTTPPAEAKVKACLTKAIASWKPATLPRAMAELQLAIPVTP